MKKFLKKLLILVILAAVAFVVLNVFFKAQEIKLGQVFKYGDFELTVTNVQVSDSRYVSNNKKSDDFLYPLEPKVGDQFLTAVDDNDRAIVVTFLVENVGKNDKEFSPSELSVNYDDGFIYRPQKLYARTTDGNWTEFSRIKLEKLTTGLIEVRAVIWVPSQVVEDTNGSLILGLCNGNYTIR